jgi:hypothetical protein
MHIDDDHRHYGSALIQIAEDPHFTAINAFRCNGRNSRCGFRVNKDIGVYIRYRSGPKGRVPIYSFVFSHENLAGLRRMSRRLDRVFLALVCVKDREICCLRYPHFNKLVDERKAERGWQENEYVIDVLLAPRKQFRVGISSPGRKGTWLTHFVISRGDFPQLLFQPASKAS